MPPKPSSARLYGDQPEAEASSSNPSAPLPTLPALAFLISCISARLMELNWGEIQPRDVEALIGATVGLKATVAAIDGGTRPSRTRRGRSTCALAHISAALGAHHARLQFLGQNLRVTDPGAHKLLDEMEAFDDWREAHLARCASCRGGAE